MYNHILPECYVDTMLVEALLLLDKKGMCNHKQGCFNVAGELKSGDFKDSFGVGVIDNDKKSVQYLNEFSLVKTVYYESGNQQKSLVLWKHKNSQLHHYFIQICPAIESWIMQVCVESNISLSAFQLPDDMSGLKKITKAQSSLFDSRFQKLFRKMRECEHNSVKSLKNWLTVLVKDNYNVDINELKNG